MRKLKVEVTKRDIQYGLRGNCNHCPIARALRRASGDKEAIVGAVTCSFHGHNINLPQEAVNFIDLFDGKLCVAPFSFEIELPATLESVTPPPLTPPETPIP